MLQWLQSQVWFLLIFSLLWFVATAILCGLSHDFEQVAGLINRIFQITAVIVLIGNFIIFGPIIEALAYLRQHWLFCLILVYGIAMVGLFIEARKWIFSGLVILCLDLIFMQVVFQNDWLTLIHLLIAAVFYGEIISVTYTILETERKPSLFQFTKDRIKSLLRGAD